MGSRKDLYQLFPMEGVASNFADGLDAISEREVNERFGPQFMRAIDDGISMYIEEDYGYRYAFAFATGAMDEAKGYSAHEDEDVRRLAERCADAAKRALDADKDGTGTMNDGVNLANARHQLRLAVSALPWLAASAIRARPGQSKGGVKTAVKRAKKCNPHIAKVDAAICRSLGSASNDVVNYLVKTFGLDETMAEDTRPGRKFKRDWYRKRESKVRRALEKQEST